MRIAPELGAFTFGESEMLIIDPLSTTPERLVPIQSVLRSLSAQEGCDGEPYDQMVQAAEYIDDLESQVGRLSRDRHELDMQLIRLREVAAELLAQLNKTYESET